MLPRQADLALERSSDTLIGLLLLANYWAFLSLSLITCKVREIQLLRDLLGVWNIDPLKLLQGKGGNYWENVGLSPTELRK